MADADTTVRREGEWATDERTGPESNNLVRLEV